jgi:hypothetical protein
MYQYYCNDCQAYGQSHQEFETCRRDSDAHWMETSHVHLEIHQATSGGGYDVVDYAVPS